MWGFLFAALTGESLWSQQNPDGVFSVTNMTEPYLFLVRDPYVHSELKLTDGQTGKLQKLNDQADLKIWTTRNKKVEESARITNKVIEITRQQVVQIELWTQGIRSLLRDDVATAIQLSGSQLTDVRQILTESQQEKQELQQQLQDGGSLETLNERFHAVQVREQERILALMPSAQQQKWVALLGSRVDLKRLGKVKFKAPDLADAKQWINSPALTLDKLKGKVVALHFYAFA
jgi:hypothetical protein